MGAYAGKNVLITGGMGFIGSHLARALVRAHARVTLVDSLIPTHGGNPFNIHDFRESVTVNGADVRDAHAMAQLVRGQHFLFNLAGQTSHLDSMTDPRTDLDINAAAQLSILEACRMHNREVRIVFASTRQIYGKPQYLPVDESHPVQPVDVNGINKLAGEWYHLLYNNVYGIRACALRLTNTFGPAMRIKDARQTFLGVWINQLLSGQSIKVYGDGAQRRDFNYVDDVVDGLLRAATCDPTCGGLFNLGGSEVVSLIDLARMLIAINGAGQFERVPFPEDRKVIDIGDYYGSFDKFRACAGWSPLVGLDEGLRRTLAFFRLHRGEYV